MTKETKDFFKSGAFVTGLCLIVSAIIFSIAFYNSRLSADYISVTGSASRQVVSDKAKFSGNFSRIVKLSGLKAGYDQMTADLKIVKDFLTAQNIDTKDVTISTISMEQNYDYNSSGIPASEKDYTLRQNIEISSGDVNKITALAQATQGLINKGVIFSVYPVEYYYTALPQMRVELLADAVKDAQARARKLVESTGQKLGSLRAAASGVVQVLPANSLEISDYGAYDTSKIDKNIMVTAKVSFGIK